jgi:Zn-dependent M28 family amino/carboxypeptidase
MVLLALLVEIALLLIAPPPQIRPLAAPASSLFDATATLRDLEILSADDMEGRAAGTAGSAKARDYIVRRFAESGVKPFAGSYLQSFPGGSNVVGLIEGQQRSGRYLVVTAHYDHLGIRFGQVFNGADDNASGVAAMIALASYFSRYPPQNPIIFAALDAEETGGAGGRNFVKTPPVDKQAIVMNVNLDMIGRAPDNRLFAAGTYHYPFLKPYIEMVASKAPVDLLIGHDRPNQRNAEDWTTESDHASFHREKIPFIYFGVEDFEQHHRPTDDFSTITPVFFIHAVETILEAVKVFDANLRAIEMNK